MTFKASKDTLKPLMAMVLVVACAFGTYGCAGGADGASDAASSKSSAVEAKPAVPSVIGKQFTVDTWTHNGEAITAEDLGDKADECLSIVFKSDDDVRVLGFGVLYTASVREDNGAVIIDNMQAATGADGAFASGLQGTYDGKVLTLTPRNADTEQFVLVERV